MQSASFFFRLSASYITTGGKKMLEALVPTVKDGSSLLR